MSGTTSTATPYRPLTVEELEDHADALELGADAARHAALEDYVRAGIAGRTGRDEAFRNAFGAKAAADHAANQVEAERRLVDMYRKMQGDALSAAEKARANGDHQAAAEHVEAAEVAVAKMRISEAQLQEAQHAASEHRAEFDRWLSHNSDETLNGAARENERQRLEDVFDAQERQAGDYREGAKELREAERLEAALPDLEAREVAGVERVRDAITEHRRLAAEAMERGWSADDPPPDPMGTPMPTPTPMSTSNDAEVIELPPMDLLRTDVEPPAVDAPVDDAAIEMPPMDLSGGDAPIEMPPMDLSTDDASLEGEG